MQVTLRAGSGDDVAELQALHERCSAATLHRRYHSPTWRISGAMARALLEPPGGQSVVVMRGDDMVAAGLFATRAGSSAPGTAELGLMVEDAHQRHGYGSRLLHALAVEAARRSVEYLHCLVQPDNDAALRVIRRAGLRALVRDTDGVTQCRIPVAALGDHAPQPSGRYQSGTMSRAVATSGLVSLLHARPELREIYAPADFRDQWVRGGA
jgi:L-amino acid N-acyltransferase YncA